MRDSICETGAGSSEMRDAKWEQRNARWELRAAAGKLRATRMFAFSRKPRAARIELRTANGEMRDRSCKRRAASGRMRDMSCFDPPPTCHQYDTHYKGYNSCAMRSRAAILRPHLHLSAPKQQRCESDTSSGTRRSKLHRPRCKKNWSYEMRKTGWRRRAGSGEQVAAKCERRAATVPHFRSVLTCLSCAWTLFCILTTCVVVLSVQVWLQVDAFVVALRCAFGRTLSTFRRIDSQESLVAS